MKSLIKQIREQVGMSQEQFACELGTTPVSINRWENGKSLPNLMAQKQVLLFCKNHHINMAENVVKGCEFAHDDERLILYHGSKNGIHGNIAPISREECDFGCAFYMGTTTLQPLTLVCVEERPKFYTLEVDLKGLKVLDIDIGIDWAMLIAYYRKQMEGAIGTNIYEKYAHFADGYDMVIGYIANDRMYTELSRFFNGDITDVALMKCLSALDLGRQYVAKTEKACKQIKIIEESVINPLELEMLKEMSIKRRAEGIALADEIVKQYRREGKYFDEIWGGK